MKQGINGNLPTWSDTWRFFLRDKDGLPYLAVYNETGELVCCFTIGHDELKAWAAMDYDAKQVMLFNRTKSILEASK